MDLWVDMHHEVAEVTHLTPRDGGETLPHAAGYVARGFDERDERSA